MNILAIDPGTTESAYVSLDRCGYPIQACAELPAFGKLENYDLRRLLTFAARNFSPVVCCEMVACYGKPVGKEVFETAVWIGRFQEACQPLSFHRLVRNQVKMHLCGATAKITDGVIRQALIDRYGPGKDKAIGKKKAKGPLYGVSADVWQALALGVTFMDTMPATARTA